MNILFLDIDGVLAPHREPGKDGGLDADMCLRLKHVLEATGCGIVLSSAWRYMGIGRWSVYGQCLIGAVGFDRAKFIIDHTVDTTALEGKPERRHLTILDWVMTHNPIHWVAVDDLKDIERLGHNRYVRTDGKVGLTPGDARQLIRLLT
jgi:hypothetical protein